MKKIIGLLFAFLLSLQLLQLSVNAKTNEVIYLYSDSYKINNAVLKNIEKQDISIKSINVDKLDYMKYFYLYQKAYAIPMDEFNKPIILAGDNYFLGNNFKVDDVVSSAIKKVKTLADVEIQLVVYFKSWGCSECAATEEYIEKLKNLGVKVVEVDISKSGNTELFFKYSEVYDVKTTTVPLIFSGDNYYHSYNTIKNEFDDIVSNSTKPLLEVEYTTVDTSKYEGIVGYLFVLFGGLIDGVNPCAMAMLILFVGLLLGAKAKKSTMINVSIAYIFGLFITYFALGLFLMEFINKLSPFISNLSFYISIFIIVFALFFFALNLYDYFVSKNKDYKKIKNQLPKPIQRFNKKIISFFSDKLNNKNLFVVYLLSFTLAVIIALTEFLCTGQVYLPIIMLIIEHSTGVEGTIKLLLYNIMFVVPLIIIAVIAIKAKSAIETSNVIREKLHIIKLITSILFLLIAVYYILRLIGVI